MQLELWACEVILMKLVMVTGGKFRAIGQIYLDNNGGEMGFMMGFSHTHT
jgi:hypothetical protein